MFNWVCPRCGRENSPSYTECPDCKERDALEQAQAEPEPPPTPHAPVYQAPPVTQEWQAPHQPPQPPQQPVYQQQPTYPQQPPAYQPPQYAPPQQYQQPPQYAPQQPPPYAQPPQQQYPPQYAPPQQQPPQYPSHYTQVYTPPAPQQPPQQPQYAAPQPVPQRPAPAPVAQPKPVTKPTTPPQRTPAPPVEEPGLAAKLGALPTPVLMLLFAGLFLLLGAGVYYGYQHIGKSSPSGPEPAAAATKPKATNPIQKYIEVVGIRLTTDAKKKPVAKFLIVNHASTEVANLGANVILWASTSRSEEDSVGSFKFHVDSIGPYESKEVSAPFTTKLKIYELPDWQNATAEVQITSPQP
jgi:hypothetical protein